MAAFSQPYHPFLSDSAFLLNSASNINPPALTLPHERHHLLTPSDFSHLFDPYSAIQHPQAPFVVQNQEPNFLKDSVSGTKVTFSHDSEASITKRHSNNENSAVLDKQQIGDDDPDSQKMTSREKRRKSRSSSQVPERPKVVTQGKSKRQKKSGKVMQGKEKQSKAEKKVINEPPTGYIHVRARRGQATDSHSLAERVRREKISERMRILQRLVPGCDKVTGKALMLDEIINYVQSLQNQVEFLSMRLASLNPTLYDFRSDLDTFMVGQEKLDNTATCRPNLHLTAFANATPATTIATPTATSTMGNTFTFTPGGNDYGYTVFNNSDPVSVQGQRENVLGQESANSLYWNMEDQGQKYLNRRHQATTYAMSTNGVY